MGARPGSNNGNHGKKGRSGRKSAYAEQADAKELWDMFFGGMTKKELDVKIKSGTFSVKEMMLKKALEGNERHISDMFKKVFPDLEKAEHSGGIEISITNYEQPEDPDSSKLQPGKPSVSA